MIDKEIQSAYGDGIIVDGTSIVARKRQVISISPAIDIIIGGGVPTGSWVVFSGPEKCGKTTTALQLASNAQAAGMTVYYLDIEGRLKTMNLTGIPGLQLDKMRVIHSVKGKILMAEDYLEIGEKVINTCPNSMLIVDSFSMLCSETEGTKELRDQTMLTSQKLQAKWIRRTSNVVPVNDIIVVGITHLMSNPGYGASVQEKSGRAVKYQGDVKLETKNQPKEWTSGEKVIGQIVTWKARYSALGGPGGEAESYIRYGEGIDGVTELVNLGIDTGTISKGGAWLTYKTHKMQGLEKMSGLLKTDKALFDEINKEVKIRLGVAQ